MKYLQTLIKNNPRKYLAFSLSWIWKHATQKEYPIAMLTAFRKRDILGNDLTLLDKRIRNQKLAYYLKALNYTDVPMEGHYIEGYKTENAEDVVEEVFFVIGNDTNVQEFEKNLSVLGEKYEQESVLFKIPDSEEAFLLGTSHIGFPEYGEKVYVGDFHPNQIGEFYSTWKKRPFKFERVGKELTGKSGYALRLMHENEKRGNK